MTMSKTAQKYAQRKPRAWQRMLSGRRLDLLDPSALDIEIEDIAHGLSRLARWNGQTSGKWAFSVAQHCLLVEDITSRLSKEHNPTLSLAGLLHDAAEYVIGDLISPFKAVVGIDYKDFEANLLRAIHMRFGLPATLGDRQAKLIKRADGIAAYYEATQLAGFSQRDALKYIGRPGRITGIELAPCPPRTAHSRYLSRFRALSKELRRQ